MIEDEAHRQSISTDLANVNFTIAVRPEILEDDAWKLLGSIVTTEFDVLEVIDKETGYMRTAWQVEGFNGSTIRTRVIVKLGDSNGAFNAKSGTVGASAVPPKSPANFIFPFTEAVASGVAEEVINPST